MTTTSTPADTGRHTLITGLHALADYLDQHPEVPTRGDSTLSYYVRGDDDRTGLANLAEIADQIGVQVTDLCGGPVTATTTHFHARRQFGPVTYQAVYITRAEMADHQAHMSYRDNLRTAHTSEEAAG